ncbi:MAG: hypothetical protein J6N98_07060 [Prevotella sp.]|nr:hypothetical protein [Prevotella sp.]
MINACGIDIEGTGAEGLTVDAEGWGSAAYDAVGVNPLAARPDVHGLAVAKDDVDVAVEGDGMVEVHFGQSGEIPLLLPVGTKAGLAAVEGYGVGVVALAVGINIGDGDGLAGGAGMVGIDVNRDVGVGHGKGCATERAGAGGVAAVLVAEWCGGCVREREADCVAAAVVEGLAELQAAAAVGGYAADGVLGSVAGEGYGADGDVGAGGDGAGGVAVVILVGMVCVCGVVGGVVGAVAEVVGVVAVVGIYLVAGEGGAGRFQDGDLGGGEEVVADFCPAFAIADEAADGVGRCAEQAAVEHAALDGERAVLLYADDAAVCAVAADGAVDSGADGAVLDADGAPAAADETAGELLVGSDGARDVQVAEGGGAVSLVAGVGLGGADVAEGGDVLRGSVGDVVAADIDGQRVAVTVEGAAEVVLAAARHAGDGVLRRADVVAELHGLAAEAVPSVVVLQGEAEGVPSGGIADGVGIGGGLRQGGGDKLGLGGWLQRDVGDGRLLGIGQRAVVDVAAGVLQSLAVLDVHGAVVAIGGDEVGGGAQAEGDGAFGGDAHGVISRCGGHLPAIDGDGPVVGIDGGMAVPGTGGADDAAVDGDAAAGIDGISVTGDGEPPRARALAVDGQGKVG